MYEQFKDDFPRFQRLLQSGAGGVPDNILPGASEEELRELEEMLELPLPESYKEFLRCARGIWLRDGAIRFSWGHPYFHVFPDLAHLGPEEGAAIARLDLPWPPPTEGMLCFAEYGVRSDGDQLLFDVGGGLIDGEYPIVHYDHQATPPAVNPIADSLTELIEALLDDGEESSDSIQGEI